MKMNLSGAKMESLVCLTVAVVCIFAQTYKNPYNFGGRQNWRIFLGLTNGRQVSAERCILVALFYQ